MRRSFLPLALLCGYADASEVVAVTRLGNAVEFRLDDGFAEVLWMNGSTVRVRQAWQDQAPHRPAPQVERIEMSLLDGDGFVRLRSRDLVIHVAKRPFALRFESVEGELIAEQTTARLVPTQEVDYRFRLQPEERLFGLGHQSSRLNRRGAKVVTTRPLLISSEGYGLFLPGSRTYAFDLGAKIQSELQVVASHSTRGDYVFYYGGSPTQILEQQAEWFGETIEPVRAHSGVLSPIEKPSYALTVEGTWPLVLRQIFQAGFSGIPVAAINPRLIRGFQTPYGHDLLAAIMPIVLLDERENLSEEAIVLRRSFESHRLTYLMEARDRGLPCIHSMAHQFPFDEEASRIEDQLFFGDEILVAPLLGRSNRRQVYLPQGVWTDWHTNQRHRGRQTISIGGASPSLPMFARNGSIVPVDRSGYLELHYFPKLGGEYFLWEPEIDQITQIHAGPAGDFLRLEIEEKVGRSYEWVLHHIARPSEVRLADAAFAEQQEGHLPEPRRWRYDESRNNLHIRLDARSGDDVILNVAFQSSDWALQ